MAIARRRQGRRHSPARRFKADDGQALAATAVAGLGLAIRPEFLTDEHVGSDARVTVLADYPVPEGGILVVRAPGFHPARNVKLLTEPLIERFCEPKAPTSSARGWK